MNKDDGKLAIRAMQAWCFDGAEIEERKLGDMEAKWVSYGKDGTPLFNFDLYEYRVKQEPREFWIRNLDDWKTGDLVPVLKGSDPMITGPRSNWIRVREVVE